MDNIEGRIALLVEDDNKLQAVNAQILRRNGYTVRTAGSLQEARVQLSGLDRLDIAVLDIILPDGNGLAFAGEVKRKTDCPVLMLTGKSTHEDIVNGVCSNADMYMTKPYRIPDLIARMEGLLKQKQARAVHVEKGGLYIDVATKQVYVNDVNMSLTAREFSMLTLLALRENSYITGQELFHAAWGQPLGEDTAALRAAITRLRKKLTGCGYTIVSSRGEGYAFERE